VFCVIVQRSCIEFSSTGCSRNNSHISKGNKNQTKQGTQKILLFTKSTYDAIFFKDKHFLNVIVIHWRGKPSRFGVIFDGCSAQFKMLVPLVTLCRAQTILSITLLLHLKSLCKSFSQFETEFDANALLLKILHFSTWKKSQRVLNTHSFKHV